MKRHLFMLLILIAAPVLACGFPLPAGMSSLPAAKSSCAENEALETCQLRQDAYQLMNKVSSATIPEFEVVLDMVNGAEVTHATMKGSIEYVVVPASEEGLGASVHVTITEGEMTQGSTTQPFSGVEFIIIGNRGYTSRDNGQTWIYEELTPDAMLGLNMLLGIPGLSANRFYWLNDPAVFTITNGDPVDYAGQSLQTQTISLDLTALLASPELLTLLLTQGMELASMAGVTEETLGFTVDQIVPVASQLEPFFSNTNFNTTIGIGDDGYIRYLDENYSLTMDDSATNSANPTTVSFTYFVTGYLTGFNEPLSIVEPIGATESEDGLFGGGLGSSIFNQ
ncbi:MAG TPA: hypothetical protein VHP83_17910 [Aggregatilineaceae bacterium]|nr:hypothetical protein [Aggregatilineaceae bacterium]